MSDIFLSYAREDQVWVERLASHLEKSGWSVWWDRRLQAGDPFDNVIEREVESARVVLVLWSTHSVNSVWVKAEATAAQHQNKLVPVQIEPIRIPMPFNAFHTADLTDWDGSQAHPNLLALLRSLLDRDDESRTLTATGTPERVHRDDGWLVVLLASEPRRRCFLLRIGTRQHELECRFRPNYLWNRFVVGVDGIEVAKGGHQYRDQVSFEFPIGDDWAGLVQLASGCTANTGELLRRCVVSIGGRVLYRESESS